MYRVGPADILSNVYLQSFSHLGIKTNKRVRAIEIGCTYVHNFRNDLIINNLLMFRPNLKCHYSNKARHKITRNVIFKTKIFLSFLLILRTPKLSNQVKFSLPQHPSRTSPRAASTATPFPLRDAAVRKTCSQVVIMIHDKVTESIRRRQRAHWPPRAASRRPRPSRGAHAPCVNGPNR